MAPIIIVQVNEFHSLEIHSFLYSLKALKLSILQNTHPEKVLS
jgi:hypothetical protein